MSAPPPPGRCRSCGAAVYFAKTATGSTMPVDAEPSPRGNVQLRLRNGEVHAAVLDQEQAERLRLAAEVLGSPLPLRLSHFATCPNASSWRKRG